IYAGRILRGAKPSELPRAAADHVRTGDQPQNRQGARADSAADAAGRGRRGDRIATVFAAVHESANGRFRCRSRRGGRPVVPWRRTRALTLRGTTLTTVNATRVTEPSRHTCCDPRRRPGAE